MDYLQKINSHTRDKELIFEEKEHKYTVKGDSHYMSVTTWNHSHFKHFDADAIIDKMMKSPKWKQSKYYGLTSEQIKKLWEDNRESAACAGTKMHYDIECYYNNVEVQNDSIEYKYFINFKNDNSELVPYRTEWMIWDEELKFAGSIDMIFENEDGTLSIYDWKRSKEISKYSKYNEFSHTECISHLPDTNYWHYSLQLNTYKALLEKNYEKKIKEMALVCLHPNNKNNNYQVIKVPDLQNEIYELFELRKKQIVNV